MAPQRRGSPPDHDEASIEREGMRRLLRLPVRAAAPPPLHRPVERDWAGRGSQAYPGTDACRCQGGLGHDLPREVHLRTRPGREGDGRGRAV
eukprot:6619147-Alexandrium_andersonii.AAC.1